MAVSILIEMAQDTVDKSRQWRRRVAFFLMCGFSLILWQIVLWFSFEDNCEEPET